MNLCLYGASSENINEIYKKEVQLLGRLMAGRGHALIFGGGASGLMGAAARGVFSGGGKIIGVSPNFFNVDGILFDKCTELIYTETMRERKQVMEDLSDACIVMPGSFGTMDELFTYACNRAIDKHAKPIFIFNFEGYYDPLKQLLENMQEAGFMKPVMAGAICFCDTIEEIIALLK